MKVRFQILSGICLLAFGCSTDALEDDFNSLENSLASKEVVIDNVIACAASNQNDDGVSVFFYPRPGVRNVRYFETENVNVDKNDFENYSLVLKPIANVFNGYLQKFELTTSEEKWAIVAFDENDKTHLSNPIRLKPLTKPTEYLPQNISISQSSNMPIFSWVDGRYDDTNIYFQVISDAQNNLISGTYTTEKTFEFYNLSNVVLNITKGTPEALRKGDNYAITLMAVSEDNWVNMIVEKQFTSN